MSKQQKTTQIDDLELMVREARFDQVREVLEKPKTFKIPRKDLARFANIANRVARPLIALRLLTPVFKNVKFESATAKEMIEYAHALRRLGAADQALLVLEKVDSQTYPETILQKANCLSTLYRYQEALPLLERFTSITDDQIYSSKVAKINLLAASIFVNDQARVVRTVEDLSQHLTQEETPLLFANLLELQGRWQIQSKNYKEAILVLEEASKLMAHAEGTWDSLQIKKSIAVAQSFLAGRVLQSLEEVSRQAVDRGQWEIQRDCDFYIAKIAGDRKLFEYLYYGTPYQPFKLKVLESLGVAALSPVYQWSVGEGGPVFDLKSGKLDGRFVGLKEGQSIHRLIAVLGTDFYKPFPLVSLFAQLFPGNYFDPPSSAPRVHQVLARVRRWAEQNEIPISIEVINGAFQMKIVSDHFQVRLSAESGPLESNYLLLERLREKMRRPFSTLDASEILGRSTSTSLRLLNWGLKQGLLTSQGVGKAKRYRFS